MPLLLLVLGLIASWLDYELNLANDLERNIADVTAQAEVTGSRLTALARRHLARGETEALRGSLSAWDNEPWLRMAAVTDDSGVILASSEPGWEGRVAGETPLAPAWDRARQTGNKVLESVTSNGGGVVLGAFPIASAAHGTRWLLEVFDRADTRAHAQLDARRQLVWTASVMAFFCFCLWAALHFGVADRLGRLARAVRDFGDGRATRIETMGGGDEVHELSEAFAAMGRRLADRERERRDLERRVIDSAESERRRIGHELHDGIGQQLTSALLAANSLHNDVGVSATASAEKLRHLSRQLRDTIDEVRGLSHGLAPVPLWEGGLQHALQALADSTARSSGMRCVFECPGPLAVSDEAVAANLYRIAQEAVNNALKHAAPAEIRIGLERRGDTIVLEIDDDGGGLPDTLPEGAGIGFHVMRHRAETMGGWLEHGAPPAGGTRIAVHIPTAR